MVACMWLGILLINCSHSGIGSQFSVCCQQHWFHSSGLCWVVLLYGHMADGQIPCWSQIPCVMAGRVAPLVPIADSATPNCLYLSC